MSSAQVNTAKRTQLLSKLMNLGRTVSTQTVFLHQAIAQTVGLNATDTKCIDLILRQADGVATAGQLSQLTGLTTGAITHILDRLEKRQFVERLRDTQDRRKVFVRVLPKSLEPLGPKYETNGIGGKNVYSHSGNISFAGDAGEVCAVHAGPPSIDCWLWISGARPGEMVQGPRSVRGHTSGDGSPFAAPDGLGHNRHRDHLWHRFPDRSLCSSGEYSSSHSACGCDPHGPSAIRLHFDQADKCQQRESTVRTTRIRMQSPLHCLHI